MRLSVFFVLALVSISLADLTRVLALGSPRESPARREVGSAARSRVCRSASACDDDDEDALSVRIARLRLEEGNTRSFLKRKPWKLPYEDARRWVQANLGADTKEEYDDLVNNGNLRTPYIPKNPEEYYNARNEWVSWDHFLGGIFDSKTPSAIKRPSGKWE